MTEIRRSVIVRPCRSISRSAFPAALWMESSTVAMSFYCIRCTLSSSAAPCCQKPTSRAIPQDASRRRSACRTSGIGRPAYPPHDTEGHTSAPASVAAHFRRDTPGILTSFEPSETRFPPSAPRKAPLTSGNIMPGLVGSCGSAGVPGETRRAIGTPQEIPGVRPEAEHVSSAAPLSPSHDDPTRRKQTALS